MSRTAFNGDPSYSPSATTLAATAVGISLRTTNEPICSVHVKQPQQTVNVGKVGRWEMEAVVGEWKEAARRAGGGHNVPRQKAQQKRKEREQAGVRFENGRNAQQVRRTDQNPATKRTRTRRSRL
jgi:hypothetical protein